MARFPIVLAGACVVTSSFGCDYTPPTTDASSGAGGASSSGGESGGQAGAAGGGMAGAGGTGGMAPGAFCDKNDPTLLACFQFNTGFSDESYKNMVTASNLTVAAGIEGSAVDFQVAKMPQLFLWDAPHWDVTNFSVELWYYARTSPTTRMGLFDSQGRYGLFLYPGDELRCISGNTSANHAGVQLNTWTHVACVQSGDALRLFVNGFLVADRADALAPSLFDGINTIGSAAPIADWFDGRIDNVRVWNTARTHTQICLAAGKQGC